MEKLIINIWKSILLWNIVLTAMIITWYILVSFIYFEFIWFDVWNILQLYRVITVIFLAMWIISTINDNE